MSKQIAISSSRHGIWSAWALMLYVLALSNSCAVAQNDAELEKLTPEQVQAELKRVTAEIERLTNSPQAPPQWKELLRLQEERREATSKRWEIERSLNARIDPIEEMDVVRRWEAPISQLKEKKSDLENYDARYSRIAGKRIFEARHAELARQPRVQTPQLKSLGFAPLTYPQIDGSTSAQPLAVLITCHCFDASSEWKGVGQIRSRVLQELGGNSRPFGWFEAEAELLEFSLVAKSDATTSARLAVIINEILATNVSTNLAYLNLIHGHTDLGLLARRPSPEEIEAARKANIELQIDACALDAFVLMVNIGNSVRNLTTQQIRDIYTNKINDWSDVGGKQNAIVAYQREENSGSQQLMKSLVMKDLSFDANHSQLVGRLMSSPFLQLSGEARGLAYSVYYYERFMSGSPRTRTIAVDGIEANPETIASRKYPFVSEVFVVTRKEISPESPAAKLRNWLLSAEGQAVVRESGYVPLVRN